MTQVGRLGAIVKTWPRCTSHSAQKTSSRLMPRLVNRLPDILFRNRCPRLGQPVPESNFVSELQKALSQQMPR
jgi:hypothetical protein